MLRLLVMLSNLPIELRAKLGRILREIREDSSGAALVEYSVLIGLITALAIAFIFGVGQFVSGAWSTLCANLNGQGIAMTC